MYTSQASPGGASVAIDLTKDIGEGIVAICITAKHTQNACMMA